MNIYMRTKYTYPIYCNGDSVGVDYTLRINSVTWEKRERNSAGKTRANKVLRFGRCLHTCICMYCTVEMWALSNIYSLTVCHSSLLDIHFYTLYLPSLIHILQHPETEEIDEKAHTTKSYLQKLVLSRKLPCGIEIPSDKHECEKLKYTSAPILFSVN